MRSRRRRTILSSKKLEEALEALNVDEQLDLIALTWLGRG
jgi:Protein of unknown function (DUF3775)